MKANEYQVLAMKTLNPKLTENDILINGVMGLCGESGEVIDLVKKHLHQGHPLDEKKMVEELGDVLWYVAEIATYLQVNLEDVMEKNIMKLAKRFPDGFSSLDSLLRKDCSDVENRG